MVNNYLSLFKKILNTIFLKYNAIDTRINNIEHMAVVFKNTEVVAEYRA